MVGDRVAFVVAIAGLAGCGGPGEQPGSGGAGGATSAHASSSSTGEGGAPFTVGSSGSGSPCPYPCDGLEPGSACLPDGTCGCLDSSDCTTTFNHCGSNNHCIPCLPGYVDCNGDVSDTCESHPQWDAHNCGSCGHDCGEGGCTLGVCGPPPVTLATSVSDFSSAIAVDATRVFFASNGQELLSVPLAGGAIKTLATGTPFVAITLDATSVYWAGTSISKIPKDGGNATTLVSTPNYPLGGIVTDGATVFYGDSTAKQIFSVPVGGGAPTALAPFQSHTPIRVDATSLYYLDMGTLMRMPKGGGNPSEVPTGLGISCFDIDGTHAYTLELGVLTMTPLDGGNPVALGGPDFKGFYCGELANDADNLYFAGQSSFGEGSVLLEIPKSGGPIKELASQGQITAIALSATHVYFVGDHDLKRVAK
jgi:hypothetical protein